MKYLFVVRHSRATWCLTVAVIIWMSAIEASRGRSLIRTNQPRRFSTLSWETWRRRLSTWHSPVQWIFMKEARILGDDNVRLSFWSLEGERHESIKNYLEQSLEWIFISKTRRTVRSNAIYNWCTFLTIFWTRPSALFWPGEVVPRLNWKNHIQGQSCQGKQVLFNNNVWLQCLSLIVKGRHVCSCSKLWRFCVCWIR